jgi:hypothetical protein
VRDQDKLEIMTSAVKGARALVAFSEQMRLTAVQIWPTLGATTATATAAAAATATTTATATATATCTTNATIDIAVAGSAATLVGPESGHGGIQGTETCGRTAVEVIAQAIGELSADPLTTVHSHMAERVPSLEWEKGTCTVFTLPAGLRSVTSISLLAFVEPVCAFYLAHSHNL